MSVLEMAINKLGLSARTYSRVLKVGTIADLAGTEEIQRAYIAEADSMSDPGQKVIRLINETLLPFIAF